jgi:hypothetical protein
VQRNRVPSLDRKCGGKMQAIDNATWRKSSYSGANGGGCVEAGVGNQRHVLVRDTTNRGGAVLNFSAEAWQSFTNSLK